MTKLTMLSWMASKDFAESLDVHRAWGLDVLDLKDHLFGKSVEQLSVQEAELAAGMIAERGLSVHCLSTLIFQDGIEQGRDAFSDRHRRSLERVLAAADKLKPTFIRLLPVRLTEREQTADSTACIERQFPWLYELYRSAVDQIHQAGYLATIENEKQSIFSNVRDILNFFAALDRPGKAHLTFDVQNLWIMGTFPSMDIYRQLKPLIGYFHVKGGQKHPETDALQWKSSLEDASWPVEEMTRQIAADGVSPVICLNPTYGGLKDNYNYDNLFVRDLEYMKTITSRMHPHAERQRSE